MIELLLFSVRHPSRVHLTVDGVCASSLSLHVGGTIYCLFYVCCNTCSLVHLDSVVLLRMETPYRKGSTSNMTECELYSVSCQR